MEVTEIVRERNRLRLATVCRNQDGEPVLDGEAWVLPSRVRVEYAAPRRPLATATALVWAPAAFAAQLTALWLAAGLGLAAQGLAPLGREPRASRRL